MIRLPIDPFVRRLASAAGAVGLSRPTSDSAGAAGGGEEEVSRADPGRQVPGDEVSGRLVDDLDASDAVETVSFGLDGTAYEVDLSAEHAAALREALAPFVAAARRAGAGAGRAGAAGRRGGRSAGATARTRRARGAAPAAGAVAAGRGGGTGARGGRGGRTDDRDRESPAATGPGTPGSDRQRSARIRQWAREQGMEVSQRGRIPERVVRAYDAAH